jgi:uncharacterized membrane protein YeaQ/YmgE (transglycosylase-associated protein family)
MDSAATGGLGLGLGLGVGLLLFLAVLALIGLAIGALARWLLPGPDPMSPLATMGYGLGGSFVGGFIGRILNTDRFSFLFAVGGAALLIWFFTRRKK